MILTWLLLYLNPSMTKEAVGGGCQAAGKGRALGCSVPRGGSLDIRTVILLFCKLRPRSLLEERHGR